MPERSPTSPVPQPEDSKPSEATWRILAPTEGYIDRHNDFGFRQIPKTASTSTLRALREERVSRPAERSTREQQLDMKIHLWGVQRSACLNEVKHRYLIIRDPIKRFLSAFQNKVTVKQLLLKAYQSAGFKSFSRIVEEAELNLLPDVNTFVSSLDLYQNHRSIRHHCLPLSDQITGVKLSWYTQVFPMENLADFYTCIKGHVPKLPPLGHYQKTSVSAKCLLAEVEPSTFESLLSIYEEDYRYLSDFYSVDTIAKQWEESRREYLR